MAKEPVPEWTGGDTNAFHQWLTEQRPITLTFGSGGGLGRTLETLMRHAYMAGRARGWNLCEEVH